MSRPYRWPWLRWLFLLLWRLRERDVLDAREGETKGPPDYSYGKVSGLDPDLHVITETVESPYVCCGYASAAMACWTARKGIAHSLASGAHPIRSQGGRPHDNGSRATELRDGAQGAHDVRLDALAVAEIPDVLRDGFAVVVNLDYAQLPGYLKVQGGDFGHSCCLYGWREDRDLVGFYDPLWPEGSAGAWAPWSDVRDALWGDGEHSGTVTTWTAAPVPEPPPVPAPPAVVCPDPDARIAYEVAYAVAADDDADVAEWIGWLRAGDPFAGDVWDLGAWQPTAPTETLFADDCGRLGSCWSRGAMPDPVASAYHALTTPALWDGSGWRAALWKDR